MTEQEKAELLAEAQEELEELRLFVRTEQFDALPMVVKGTIAIRMHELRQRGAQ